MMAVDEVLTYKEAMSSSDAPQWKKTIKEELQAIEECGNMMPADFPPGRVPITSRIIFKRKFGHYGSVSGFKARLVPHGYRQQFGVDYDETYVPVVEWNIVIIIMSYMLMMNAHKEMLDFVTAFLNRDVDEETYIKVPIEIEPTGKIYRLVESLHGLKQSPRTWYKRLEHALKQLRFTQLKSAEF